MVARGISEKTAKIVWSRSGGLCAYPKCFKPLIIDPPIGSVDPHTVIGQMAHVVAHSLEGPRGEQTFRGSNRNGPDNLILLCPEHHLLVDQQRNRHTVDWLC